MMTVHSTGNVLRRFFVTLLLLAVAVLPSGCSGLTLLDVMTPAGKYVAETGIPYGTLDRQKLDIYRPPGQGPFPVIVFIYGGGWESGDRGQYRFVAESLTRHGYLVAIPDYRTYPEARFPTFIEDAAKATAWVHANIAKHGGEPERMVLMGHSAGAHIAAMLTYDKDYLAAAGMTPRDLQGFIGLAGPYDFLPLTSRRLQTILAAPDMAATQPINFASKEAPPSLLLHGLTDTTVMPQNSISLAARLHELGAPVETTLYPGMSHSGILLGLSSAAGGDRPVLPDVLDFLGHLPTPH